MSLTNRLLLNFFSFSLMLNKSFDLFVPSIETDVNVQIFLFFSQIEYINLHLAFKVHRFCWIKTNQFPHFLFDLNHYSALLFSSYLDTVLVAENINELSLLWLNSTQVTFLFQIHHSFESFAFV